MADRPKVCIDRVLPTEFMRPQRTMRVKGGDACHIADRQGMDERLDPARALHGRHRKPASHRPGTSRLVGTSGEFKIRFQQRGQRGDPHCV